MKVILELDPKPSESFAGSMSSETTRSENLGRIGPTSAPASVLETISTNLAASADPRPGLRAAVASGDSRFRRVRRGRLENTRFFVAPPSDGANDRTQV
ncbi:MAG TPA: hypothetical protein PLZ31_10265 [Myxococcota bacterium]|nr:hypothetical protein [Myxococcota bacterium]